ncbi:hypothetical protein [Streptomyces sp. NPDC127066]|uniref:hypothetical protein n=1 Tax=Streptomyces sp. NPDC127066 TaxID=3347125 RepID=UPI0036567072
METDALFWDSLVFDGIDEVDVEAVIVAFGAVDVVGRGLHSWQGLGRAVETCVAAHRDCLRTPPPKPLTRSNATRADPGPPQNDSDPVGRRAERKKGAHSLVHELFAQGHSCRAIARHLGWGLNTALRDAAAARWQDTFRENRPWPSGLAPASPTWNDGSPQDARTSPNCTANCLPSMLPSPTRWSAPTSPPCAPLRRARHPSH